VKTPFSRGPGAFIRPSAAAQRARPPSDHEEPVSHTSPASFRLRHRNGAGVEHPPRKYPGRAPRWYDANAEPPLPRLGLPPALPRAAALSQNIRDLHG
jgi:hypothetical protein